MDDSVDIIHGNYIVLKRFSRGYEPMKISNSYKQHMQNFSNILMMPSHDYEKFTQPTRV